MGNTHFRVSPTSQCSATAAASLLCTAIVLIVLPSRRFLHVKSFPASILPAHTTSLLEIPAITSLVPLPTFPPPSPPPSVPLYLGPCLLRATLRAVFLESLDPRPPSARKPAASSCTSLPVDALFSPSNSPCLDFSFPIGSQVTPAPFKALLQLRPALHHRYGDCGHVRTPGQVKAVDAGA